MEKDLWAYVQLVKQQSPLVHNITNYVVMNNTANALLAAGASPVMAHAKVEIPEMVGISASLVVNIGTLDEYWADSMLLAANCALLTGKPWVLDPVGAGATPYRDQVLAKLLEKRPTVIRGNASEIIALGKAQTAVTKGVDSTAASADAVEIARQLSDQYNCVVCISGETDIIIDGSRRIDIRNGHPMMTKVTGLGCSASALIGAFIAVGPDRALAVAAAMALLAIAGELAAPQSNGPGTLQLNIIDKLYNISHKEFMDTIKLS